MKTHSLTLAPDHVVMRDLRIVAAKSNETTAHLLELLAEVDARGLSVAEGYSSMYLFCVHDLHMSEDTAYKRIQVARAARRFPAIIPAIAQGRLHLTAVVMLAPHLTAENAEGLIAAATHGTKAGISAVLAQHCPRPDVPAGIRDVPGAPTTEQLVPEPVALTPSVLGPVESWAPRPKVTPTSPGRFAVQFMLDQDAHDELRHARALVGDAVPSGDLAEFYRWAVREVIKAQEQRVFAASARSRPRGGAAKGRRVPAGMRRAVWQRDQGRCTFVSEHGHRCLSDTRLELDHIEPVARGGETTVENLRLRCRAHNQYEAERVFGAGFMKRKRKEARGRTARERKRRAVGDVSAASRQLVPEPVGSSGAGQVSAQVTAQVTAPVDPRVRRDEVIPYLRALGFRVDEAKRGAAMCDAMPDASLEARVRFAISGLGRGRFERSTHVPSPAG